MVIFNSYFDITRGYIPLNPIKSHEIPLNTGFLLELSVPHPPSGRSSNARVSFRDKALSTRTSGHRVECLGILGTKNGCPIRSKHGRFKQAKMVSESHFSSFFMDQNVERSNIEV